MGQSSDKSIEHEYSNSPQGVKTKIYYFEKLLDDFDLRISILEKNVQILIERTTAMNEKLKLAKIRRKNDNKL